MPAPKQQIPPKPAPNKTTEPQNNPRDQRIRQLFLDGVDRGSIAERFGVHRTTVTRVIGKRA